MNDRSPASLPSHAVPFSEDNFTAEGEPSMENDACSMRCPCHTKSSLPPCAIKLYFPASDFRESPEKRISPARTAKGVSVLARTTLPSAGGPEIADTDTGAEPDKGDSHAALDDRALARVH